MIKYIVVGFLAAGIPLSNALPLSHEQVSTLEQVVGKVLDLQGNPIAGADVCAYAKPAGERFCGFSRVNGEFTIGIKKPGVYVISAKKEEEFYPDIYGNFYDAPRIALPEVVVGKETTAQEVIVYLERKVGKLKGRFVDAESGNPVTSARVDICREDATRTCMSISKSFSDGRFLFLVPDAPFTFKVSSGSGYEDWYAPNGSKQTDSTLRVEPSQTLELTVSLRPIRNKD